MQENEIKLDYQRNVATVSIKGRGAKVLIINDGKTKCIKLPSHGELNIITHEDKITLFNVVEKCKF